MVVVIGGALWLAFADATGSRRWCATLLRCALLRALPTAPIRGRSDCRSGRIRIVQPNIGQQDKWRAGFRARSRRAGSIADDQGTRRHAPDLLARSGGHRSARGRPRCGAASLRRRASGSARPARLGPGRPAADRRPIASPRATGGPSMARPTASMCWARSARSSAATTRRTSSLTANICRCARCSRRSACRGWRRATSISPPGPGPRTIELPGDWGKVGFQLCYEIIFSGEVVDRAQPPRLHLQSVERRLVRPLGPAAAPRPGAAARGRGRPAGDPLDAHRHQRGDRRATGAVVAIAALAKAGVIDADLRRRPLAPRLFARLGNLIPLALGFLLLIAAIALDRRRSLQGRYNRSFISSYFADFAKDDGFHAQQSYLFTSESVSEGHPDKVADQISDAIVDLFLSKDPEARVACETLTTTQRIVLGRRNPLQGRSMTRSVQGHPRLGARRARRDRADRPPRRSSASATSRTASTGRPSTSRTTSTASRRISRRASTPPATRTRARATRASCSASPATRPPT